MDLEKWSIKPVELEAVQVTPENWSDVAKAFGGKLEVNPKPGGVQAEIVLYIPTMAGGQRVEPYSYVFRVKATGQVHVMIADEFREKYERATELRVKIEGGRGHA